MIWWFWSDVYLAILFAIYVVRVLAVFDCDYCFGVV